MDDRDVDIIKAFQEDGKATNKSIAETINTSEETVRRRRDRLLLAGDMRIVGVPNSSALGYTTQAVVGLSVDTASLDSVADALADITEVTWVAITTGVYDILAWVVLRSTAELRSLLAERISVIEGVQRAEASVSLENKKEQYGVSV